MKTYESIDTLRFCDTPSDLDLVVAVALFWKVEARRLSLFAFVFIQEGKKDPYPGGKWIDPGNMQGTDQSTPLHFFQAGPLLSSFVVLKPIYRLAMTLCITSSQEQKMMNCLLPGV